MPDHQRVAEEIYRVDYDRNGFPIGHIVVDEATTHPLGDNLLVEVGKRRQKKIADILRREYGDARRDALEEVWRNMSGACHEGIMGMCRPGKMQRCTFAYCPRMVDFRAAKEEARE